MTLANNPTPDSIGTGDFYFDSAGDIVEANTDLVSAISLSSTSSTGSLEFSNISSSNPKTGFNNTEILEAQSITSTSSTGVLEYANISSSNPKTGFNNTDVFEIQSVSSHTPTAIITQAEIKANNPITGFGTSGVDPKIIKYEMTIRI